MTPSRKSLTEKENMMSNEFLESIEAKEMLSSLRDLRGEYSKNLVEQGILYEKIESLLMEIKTEVRKLPMHRMKICSRIRRDRAVRCGCFIFAVGLIAGLYLGGVANEKSTVSPARLVFPLEMSQPRSEKGVLPHPVHEKRALEPWPAIGKGRIEEVPVQVKDVPLEEMLVSPEMEAPESSNPVME